MQLFIFQTFLEYNGFPGNLRCLNFIILILYNFIKLIQSDRIFSVVSLFSIKNQSFSQNIKYFVLHFSTNSINAFNIPILFLDYIKIQLYFFAKLISISEIS